MGKALEIYENILGSIDSRIMWSWGIDDITSENDVLKMKVNATFYKGFVYVQEKKTKYLVTWDKGGIKSSLCRKDKVGKFIDELIERPVGLTDKEYRNIALYS